MKLPSGDDRKRNQEKKEAEKGEPSKRNGAPIRSDVRKRKAREILSIKYGLSKS